MQPIFLLCGLLCDETIWADVPSRLAPVADVRVLSFARYSSIAGMAGQGDWQLVQLFMHGTKFGITDPQFGNDIGFYAFTLPFILWLKNWLFIAVTIAFFGALISQYLFGGIRLAGRGGQLSAPARMQLAFLIGLFVLLKAFAYLGSSRMAFRSSAER